MKNYAKNKYIKTRVLNINPSYLYSPVGLDVGAETPEEIAASLTAEIVAVFRGRTGGMLRNRVGPIHER